MQYITRETYKYIANCPQCREISIDKQKPNSKLQLIMKPLQPYYTVALDFIVGLPKERTIVSFWKDDPNSFFNAFLNVVYTSSRKLIIMPGRVDQSTA